MTSYEPEEEMRAGYVNLGHVKVLATTKDAILILDSGFVDRKAWIPRSQIDPDSEVPSEEEGILFVSDWLADKIEWKEA